MVCTPLSQLEFKNLASKLYTDGEALGLDTWTQCVSEGEGAVSDFLAICALNLRLVNPDQRQKLNDHSLDPEALR